MIRYLLGLLVVAAGFYIASLYKSTAIALLGCTQAFLMAISFLYLMYEKRSIQIILDMPPAMADQGEPIYIRFRARHRYRGCYGKIKVQVAVAREGHGSTQYSGTQYSGTEYSSAKYSGTKSPDAKYSGTKYSGTKYSGTRRSRARCKWLQVEGGHGVGTGKGERAREQVFSGFLSIAEPGSYEVRLRRVRIYDMTGLFCIEQRRAVRGERALLGVLPRIYPMGISLSGPVRNFAGDAEIYDSLRSGTDASETLKLRPFQKGDELRNIHWKLSAKAGELVVRENSMPRGCPVAVLVEAFGGDQEAMLQCAASLSFCLMDQECPHYVAWYSGSIQDVVRVRVDDEESFYEAMLRLMREGGTKEIPDIQARYREKYSGEPLLHWIRVGDGPSLQVDNQEALRLKASALERELGEAELLL